MNTLTSLSFLSLTFLISTPLWLNPSKKWAQTVHFWNIYIYIYISLQEHEAGAERVEIGSGKDGLFSAQSFVSLLASIFPEISSFE